MKIALILLFAMVAVAVEAMDLTKAEHIARSRKDSGLDLDDAGADAGGIGEGVAAQSAVIAQQDKNGAKQLSAAGASAKKGVVSATSYMGHLAIRKFDEKPEEPEQGSELKPEAEEEPEKHD